MDITVFIEKDASVTFLDTPLTRGFNLGPSVTRRASHVEPDNVALRVLFHMLRSLFNEKSIAAEFTRRWPCLWRANMALSGGPILPGRWYDRQEAINAEIAYFNTYGVNR